MPHSIINFVPYITERTQDFSGRDWVFEILNAWLANPDSPAVFLLTGEPGSGKTAISARLTQFSEGTVPVDHFTRLTRDFLSAIHFCSARDRRWINPYTFTESLALQLAGRYPIFAEALAEKSGDRQINIQVSQQAETVSGQMAGVVINNLAVGSISPEDAFNRVVREPLEVLCQTEQRQIIILVDALDETLAYSGSVGIVNLLAKADHLPPTVRLILTSRAEERVENEFFEVVGLYISEATYDRHNETDILCYLETRIAKPDLAPPAAVLSQEQHADLITQITTQAAGNFLYIRFWLDAVVAGNRLLTDLDGLPAGLDGLYYDSLDRVVKLGEGKWRSDYAPLMGILSVSRQDLTLADLARFTGQDEGTLWQNLVDLKQFIEQRAVGDDNSNEPTYRLYHQSVVDFLQLRQLKHRHERLSNQYYLSAARWHRQIANYYLPYHDRWTEILDDSYLFNNLSAHLTALAADGENELRGLILSPEWLQAQKNHNPSLRIYTEDVNRALSGAAARSINGLPDVITYGLLKGTLTTHGYEMTSDHAKQLIEARQVDALLEWSSRLPDTDWFKVDLMQGAAEIAAQDGQTERACHILQNAAMKFPELVSHTTFPLLRSIAIDLLMLDDQEGIKLLLSIAEKLPDPGILESLFNDKSKAVDFLQQANHHLEQGQSGLSLIQELDLKPYPAIEKLADERYMRGGTHDVLYASSQAALTWARWAEILNKCDAPEQAQFAFEKAFDTSGLIPPKTPDERVRVFARLAEVATFLNQPEDEVRSLLKEAAGFLEQTPDALSPLYDKTILAHTAIKIGHEELALQFLKDILKRLELDQLSRRYEQAIILTRLAPCAIFFQKQDEFLASRINNEAHRQIVALSWQAHQGDVEAAESLLNRAGNIEGKDGVYIELIRSSLEAVTPALKTQLNDDTLLERWLITCCQIAPLAAWLHWLADILSEVNFSDEIEQQLAQTLIELYDKLSDKEKTNLASQIVLPLAHLPILDRDRMVSLFHTTFVQEKPYHRRFALGAIENSAPLLLNLAGKQAALDTWQQMQALERLFE